MDMSTTEDAVDCVVVGGGPAGMMAGLLLARQGVRVRVLEKHSDFLRDFRGDTIHPSTMRIMEELGIVDRFLDIPHRQMKTVTVSAPDGEATFVDFSLLPQPFNYLAFMPQWDFLDFVADEAAAYPTFELVRDADVTELIVEDDRAQGVRYATTQGERTVRAPLTIGADGRHSTVRSRAWLTPTESDAPMDVLWFRLGKRDTDRVPFVSVGAGFTIIAIDRGPYWQVAYCIPKGGYDRLRSHPIGIVADRLREALPDLAERFADDVGSWDDIRLLSVAVNRLDRWHRPGLLCIGDAAHAMSPAGGVGINLAIQDAVAAARMLGPELTAGRTPAESLLKRVQKRRERPARIIQAGQVKILADLYPKQLDEEYTTPTAAKIIRHSRMLQKMVARVIGIGLRPEHIS
jgi:2-polyprenyl-6-methoxyphenol hydroxylase-like FAD-dependent oxidoreductase